jgi:DNA invertase Pin-like site-specific DNA recombinase
MNAPDLLPAAGPDRQPLRSSAPLADVPASPSRPTKIQPWHLERLAVVYVRQSSPHQVINNKESAEVQAKFRDVAVAWGWPTSRVTVIDEDQARSATSAEARTGFHRLLTEINLNHVGIILGFQVSRLSRANSDWYHLLERCAVFHTLLADMDGIYDPTTYNDRLLLGLKGTMSEAELHLLRQRLYQGRLNKARRGEQFTSAPIGYVRSRCGNRLELDPDEQVQGVVRLIFDKFDELGSAGAVLRYLVHNEIKLGVRVQHGPDAGRLDWHQVVRPTLYKILQHPFYAGCYAFPLNHADPRRKRPGHPGSGQVRVERLNWKVVIPDKIPAYITWERNLANLNRMASNRNLPSTRGVARGGPSLLSGLVYCGRCGRRMRVAYHAQGTPVYYMCNTRAVECAEPVCQSLSGGALEALIAEAVLQAIEPANVELSIHAVADFCREQQRLGEHWQQRLERARVQAERAFRQYHATEPENRLVARELERRWEQALGEERAIQEQYDRFLAEKPRELTAADRRRIQALACDIPGLWHARSTKIQERQQIVRCLVERITVAVRGQTEWVDVTIRWAGGSESRHEICRPAQRYDQLANYRSLRGRVAELWRGGSTAGEIAEQLNREGFHPPRGPTPFNRQVVSAFLARQGLSAKGTRTRRDPEKLEPDEWRIDDLAVELGMPAGTLRHWRRRGWARARKSTEAGGSWIFWADQAELERLRRLRAWRRGGYDLERPSELTTPLAPTPHERHHKAKATRRSSRESAKSKMGTSK